MEDSQTLRELGPFEQQAGLYKLYTQLCYCFPVQDETAYSHSLKVLTTGLEYLGDAFPWLAGQVILGEASNTGEAGKYTVKPLHRSPRLVTKDLRKDDVTPSLQQLRAAGYPVAMLSEDWLAPRKTLEMAFGQPEDPAEVFIVQANFIKGGLLLVIATQHNLLDMTGQAEMTRLLSKACRGEEITDEERRIGNMSPGDTIRLLDEDIPALEKECSRVLVPKTLSPAPAAPPVRSLWIFINFTAAALADLKAKAASSLTSGFVSTDDCLCALIWQSVTRARLPRLSPDEAVTFARAIDPRRFLEGVPPNYPGLVQNMAYATASVSDLTSKPLGHLASLLRAAVDPKTSDLGRNTRALATLLQKVKDKTSINPGGVLNMSQDVQLSSWAAVKCYETDFGLGLGAPEMVRRPGFTPVESLMYLLPKTPTGDVTAMVCLRDEDMERLRADQEFGRVAQFVG